MPLQTSGQISLSDIAGEIPTIVGSELSLYTLSTLNININSPLKPDGNSPHALSEFYGYDHEYMPGTLVAGSDIVATRRFFWQDLCGAGAIATYLLNTPSVYIGTKLTNSNGSSLSILPAYVYIADINSVVLVETNDIVSAINDCAGAGDGGEPVDPGDGPGSDLEIMP